MRRCELKKNREMMNSKNVIFFWKKCFFIGMRLLSISE